VNLSLEVINLIVLVCDLNRLLLQLLTLLKLFLTKSCVGGVNRQYKLKLT
jgi:hypothetical protein